MVIDFHARYPRQENFLPRLLDLLPEAGIDRICLCSAGEMFGHVTNAEVRRAFEAHRAAQMPSSTPTSPRRSPSMFV